MKNKPSRVLMVRPVRFGFNRETAATNLFQKNNKKLTSKQIQSNALKEFSALVKLLIENEIETEVIKDTAAPVTPDSVFPNNVISFHVIENFSMQVPAELNFPNDMMIMKNAKVTVLYSMMAKNRRKERKKGILNKTKGYKIVFDLSANETKDVFLEGTGSIVFDYENRLAYACHSPRTSIKLLEMLCKQLDYSVVSFHAADKNGNDIYHTNVMLCIGKGFAVVCEESVKNKEELFTLMKSLIDTDHRIITIDYKQLKAFAGNMYQLFNKKGKSFIVMSEQAYVSLHKKQISTLKKFGKIIHTPLYTIEKYGGGSARCMIADVRC